MKIIVTTSDRYLHLIPVFEYLYMKYWGDTNIELVGHEKPITNIPFVSLGTQGSVKDWSTDLRRYFETQPDHFIWLMEDTILKSRVSLPNITDFLYNHPKVGRVDLTGDVQKRPHEGYYQPFVIADPASRYRLSTQPSIWSKRYLLQYLQPGMDPWTFETQDPKNDDWDVLGFINPPVNHNEGVRRFDIKKLDLSGLCDEDIEYIKLITEKW